MESELSQACVGKSQPFTMADLPKVVQPENAAASSLSFGLAERTQPTVCVRRENLAGVRGDPEARTP